MVADTSTHEAFLMAGNLVVQRGHLATHNMHVYPGEVPTGLWASLEAQNGGYAAGNWQCHLFSTPGSEWWQVEKSEPNWEWETLNFWRPGKWPRLGSYAHLSFWAEDVEQAGKFGFVLQIGVISGDWFHAATVNYDFPAEGGEQITFQWNMEDSDLKNHLDDGIKIRLLGHNRVDGAAAVWILKMNKWCMYTANCPF